MENTNKEREIVLTDVLKYLLRKWKVILTVTIIASLLGTGFALIKNRTAASNNHTVKDETAALNDYIELNETKLNVLGEAIYESRLELEEMLEKGFQTSVFVREYTYEYKILGTEEEGFLEFRTASADRFFDELFNDAFLWELSQDTGIDTDTIRTMISMTVDKDTVVIEGHYDDPDVVEKVMDGYTAYFEERVGNKEDLYVSAADIRSYYREERIEAADISEKIEVIQALEDSYSKTQEILDGLGISTEGDTYVVEGERSVSVMKYALLGFCVGLIGGCGIYVISYCLSDKLHSENEIGDIYGLYHIATLNKKGNGIAIKRQLEYMMEDKAQTVLCSTLNAKDLQNGTQVFKEGFSIAPSVLESEESLDLLSGAKDIIIVERTEQSKMNQIDKEIKYIEQLGKKIKGYILI